MSPTTAVVPIITFVLFAVIAPPVTAVPSLDTIEPRVKAPKLFTVVTAFANDPETINVKFAPAKALNNVQVIALDAV